jgi:hypothetical protein
MTEQEQVDALWEVQGGHEIEDELAKLPVTQISAYQGGGVHASDIYEVVLENGRLAYFKPANGLLSPVGQRALRNYGQTPVSATIAECAAWQFAKRMGEPWSELVTPTGLRFLTLPDRQREVGALTVYRPGQDRRRGAFNAVPEQALAGAFFDALIAQQDRNEGNILWYEPSNQLYLIDHGFSFAKPGDNSGEVVLTAWRAQRRERELSEAELETLERLGAGELGEIGLFLAPDRMDALVRRVEAMKESRQMPLVGEF